MGVKQIYPISNTVTVKHDEIQQYNQNKCT